MVMTDPSSEDVELARQAQANAKQALKDAKRLFIKLIIFGVIIGAIASFGVVKFISLLDTNLAPSSQRDR